MDRHSTCIGSGESMNTRTFYKGKSFRYNYEWKPNGHYSNSEFIQDFVSYEGKMYVCIETNVGMVPTDTRYWRFVMEGQPGPSIMLNVSDPDLSGKIFLQLRYSESDPWESFYDLSGLRGEPGKAIVLERNPVTGNVEWRYEGDSITTNQILLFKDDLIGPQGNTIKKVWVENDGYLYIQMSQENIPRRVGYVRGDNGDDGREVMIRIDNDRSLGPEESGTGTHLQWKYAGEDFKLWRNLIQINELFNIALAGLQLEYEVVTKIVGGVPVLYDRLFLASYQTAYNPGGDLILTNKIANLSYVDVPVRAGSGPNRWVISVTWDSITNELVILYQSGSGIEEERIPINIGADTVFIEENLTDQIDGITNTFTPTNEITIDTAIAVYLNGQRQFKDVHYEIVGNTIVLSYIPEVEDELFLVIGNDTSTGGSTSSIPTHFELRDVTCQSAVLALVENITNVVKSAVMFEVGSGLKLSSATTTYNTLTIPKLIIELGTCGPSTIHTIVASAGSGGTINPPGIVTVADGNNQTFNFTPSTGYEIDTILVDGSLISVSTSYTFYNVQGDHTIQVTFKPIVYTITPSVSGSGNITPDVVQNVNHGSNSPQFTFTPDSGFELTQVLINGINNPTAVTNGYYTFINVTSNQTIQAVFTLIPLVHTITATAGSNGSINPSGSVDVSDGTNKTFNFLPNTGYEIDTITVDGSPVAVTNSYTFYNVTTTHTIHVTFKIKTYTITPSATNGTITPNTTQTINHGTSSTQFIWTPNTDYVISQVLIDGVNNPTAVTNGNYTFTNVTANHTIQVIFAMEDQPTLKATINVPGVFEEITQNIDGYYYFDLLLSGCNTLGFRYLNTETIADWQIYNLGAWVTLPPYNIAFEWAQSTQGDYTQMLYNAVDEITGDCFTVGSPRQYRIKLN